MRCAEGGKIDTVEYSAACGALNSSASAGAEAASGTSPIKTMAKPQKAGVLPALPGRARLPVDPIRHHISSQKNLGENYRSGFTMPIAAA